MTLQPDRPALSSASGAPPKNIDPGYSAAPGLRPGELYGALRQHAVLIAACALAGGIAAYAYAATLPKSYTAYGALAVGGDRLAIPELQGVLSGDTSPDPMPFVRTEAQALGSRQLVAKVAGELHLDRDPEFNAALRPPTATQRLVSWAKSWLPHPQTAGAPANGNDAIVNAADHALAISQDNRSLVIGISFTAHDPTLAASFVNRLIADYTAERQNRRSAADHDANAAISQRVDQVRGEIEQIEKHMQDLRTQSGLVSLRAGSVGQQQVEDLATEASRATEQRMEIQASLARAQAAVSSGASDELASVLGSPTISRLREQEAEASAKVADLSARFGPAYPALRSAQADLAAIRREVEGEAHRIVASLSSQLQVARAHEADVQAQLARATKAGATAQDVQAQLHQLEQDAATRRSLYSTLLEREQQTVAQPQKDEIAEVRVLNAASVPGLPSSPNMKLSAGLGALAAAILAGVIAVARSLSRRRFRGDADILATTGATVLARLRRRGGAARWHLLAAGTTKLDTDDEAALRSANAHLRVGGRVGSGRVIAFAGAQRGPAATAIAAALARQAAREGQPALLIDTAAEADDGVDFLGGQSDWRDAVTQDAGSPLEILSAAGSGAAGISGSRVAMENLLIEAREDYRLIVFAGPEVSDAESLALARTADATVMVIDEAVADPASTREAALRLAGMSRAQLCAIAVGEA